jgi:4-hydroxyphenylpyruvate dioxygenase
MAAASDLQFWCGTALEHGFEGACDAAASGGFTSISLSPYLCGPLGAGGARHLAEQRGLRIGTVESLAHWLPGAEAPAGSRLAGSLSITEGEIFELAAELGADSLNLVEVFGIEYPFDVLVEQFSGVCDRAAPAGLRVTLEFTPLGSIRHLSDGWSIVSAAGRPNGGLVFDMWHYFKGGTDDELLERIPGDRLFEIQVNNGFADARAPMLLDEARHHRAMPDEGDWDVSGVLGRLKRKPGLGRFGIEVFEDGLMALPPEEIGRRTGEALQRALS